MKHLAFLTLFALAACGDQAPKEDPQAKAAKAAEAAKAQDLADALTVNVRCYAAIKWQEVPLKRGGIGDPGLYLTYYRNLIEKKLGDATIPAAPPAPALSKATLDPYLDWAVKDHIDSQFAPADKKTAAQMTVSTCVQSAAEFGAGPMATLNPAQRYDKMQYLREHLRLRGN